MPTSGHLFITRGDITRLHCDALLIPTDIGRGITRSWRECRQLADVLDGEGHIRGDPEGLWDEDHRAEVRQGSTNEPVVVLTNVGGVPGTPTRWYLDGVDQFLDAAEHEVRTRRTTDRAAPLIALPLVGTGLGGMVDAAGDVVRDLVRHLLVETRHRPFDVALVLWNGADYAAAQAARRQLVDDPTTVWRLQPAHIEQAQRLSSAAAATDLVLFVGAGVSAAAGLPPWTGLLRELADRAGIPPEQLEPFTTELPVIDQARIVQQRLSEAGQDLGLVIVDLVSSSRHSIAHLLLAALPVDQIVTTNYDTLLEQACSDAGRAAAVLPYEPAQAGGRWLLKLHGSVTHPDDIVITREDFLRFGKQRAALVGIVQALLITRHMLFVGFSLTDDNFIRIVDDVRQVIRESGETGGTPFGTALMVEDRPLLRELWQEDLHFVTMADGQDRTTGLAVRARELEIFLDLLLFEASRSPEYLLNPAFDGALTASERTLKAALQDLVAAIGPIERDAPAWAELERCLERYGLSPDNRR